MSTAKILYELQEIDLDKDQMTQNLDQVKEQLGKDDDVAAARTALCPRQSTRPAYPRVVEWASRQEKAGLRRPLS